MSTPRDGHSDRLYNFYNDYTNESWKDAGNSGKIFGWQYYLDLMNSTTDVFLKSMEKHPSICLSDIANPNGGMYKYRICPSEEAPQSYFCCPLSSMANMKCCTLEEMNSIIIKEAILSIFAMFIFCCCPCICCCYLVYTSYESKKLNNGLGNYGVMYSTGYGGNGLQQVHLQGFPADIGPISYTNQTVSGAPIPPPQYTGYNDDPPPKYSSFAADAYATADNSSQP